MPFSWDTVPVFQHLAFPNATDAVAFPPARLAWLAKFPLVIIEHAQGQGYAYTARPNGTYGEYGPEPYDPARYDPTAAYLEQRAAEAAVAIKAHTPQGSLPAKVLYYQNTNSGLPYYAMAASIADRTMQYSGSAKECLPARPSHQGGDGMLPNYRTFSWDHTNPAVTEHFVESFRNATSGTLGGALDGTFMDTTACYNFGSGQAAASLATGRAMQRAVPVRSWPSTPPRARRRSRARRWAWAARWTTPSRRRR